MHLKLRRTAGLAAALCLLLQLFCPAMGLAAEAPELDTALATPAEDLLEAASVPASDEEPPAKLVSVPLETDDPDLPDADSPEDEPIFETPVTDLTDEPGCTFRAAVISTDPRLKEADLLVWTAADQSDMRRYNAQRVVSLWSADVDIAAFHYAYGTYQAQFVGRDRAGVVIARSETIEIPVGPEELETLVEPIDSLATRYRLTLSGGPLPGDPDVWFEIRDAGGKTAVAALPASVREDVYTAVLDPSSLGAAGSFEVVACCGHTGECSQSLSTATVEVGRITLAGLSVDADGSTGTFSYTSSVRSPLGIRGARIAIWSDPEQKDLRWVDMVPAAGGFQSPVQDIRDYSGFGVYRAHVYVQLGDGSEELAVGLESAITPRNYVSCEKVASGRYNISVTNPSPQRNLKAAVWSEANGQDDLVWYPASAQGNGVWTATALGSRHASGGTWFAHFYSGNELLGAVSFTVPSSEVLSAAEQRIANGCQRVYNQVGTDLHRNYLWVVNNLSYVRRSGHLTPPSGYTRQQWYAVEGLEKHSGNCYTYAATFCELAKGLGYNARYVEGAVYGVGQKWWPHGFVLITIDGSTYICDPELQYASSTGRNLYMQPISNPRATYRW